MSKNIKVPDVRFKGFEEEWEYIEASDVFRTFYDKNHPDLPVLSASQEYGMVVRNDVGFNVQHNKDNEAGYKRVLPGQYVIHLRSFQGGFAHSTIEGITSPAYTIIEFRDPKRHDDIFWKYILTSKEFIKRLETVTYGIRDGRSISFDDFSELGFNVPNIDEQRKIGKTLTIIDTLIRKLEQKLEKLRNIKQALLNQMFINVNREGTAPLIRFKEFEEEWETKPLYEYLEVSNEKNISDKYDKYDIYSVSREYGVVNQIEYQGKSFAGASLLGYGVIHTGDVVYTKSPLKTQPYGIIKTNQDKDGIVSALYGVFHPKKNVSPTFVQAYFALDNRLNDYLRPLVNKGAKNTLLISDEDAITGKVVFPKRDEQQIVSESVMAIEGLVASTSSKLSKMRTMKQSLLQKMFV